MPFDRWTLAVARMKELRRSVQRSAIVRWSRDTTRLVRERKAFWSERSGKARPYLRDGWRALQGLPPKPTEKEAIDQQMRWMIDQTVAMPSLSHSTRGLRGRGGWPLVDVPWLDRAADESLAEGWCMPESRTVDEALDAFLFGKSSSDSDG